MTVRELMMELFNKCGKLEDDVNFYVCAKTKTMEQYLEASKDEEWCIDETLDVYKIEKIRGNVRVELEELSY